MSTFNLEKPRALNRFNNSVFKIDVKTCFWNSTPYTLLLEVPRSAQNEICTVPYGEVVC